MKLIDFDVEAKNSTYSSRERVSIIRESTLVPITPAESEWTTAANPERLARGFKFNDFRKMYDFISELLVYQQKIGHHGKITIDHLDVVIETFTKDVNAVTELDVELAKYCDLLYRDIDHYYAADNVDNDRFQ